MCIKDNPRYKRLVEMGLDSNIGILYHYRSTTRLHVAHLDLDTDPCFYSVGKTAEAAFDHLFSRLEEHHAPHQ